MPVNVASLLCGSSTGGQSLHCWLDISCLLRDVVLTFLWSLVLIYTWAALRKSPARKGLARYSCHDARWMAALALLVAHLIDLAEMLLRSDGHWVDWLELSVPVGSGLVVLLSCVYFDRIEVWRRDVYLVCTYPYWLSEIAVNVIRWIHSGGWEQLYATRDGSLAVRPVLIWIKVGLAIVILFCDIYAAFFQERSRRGIPEPEGKSESDEFKHSSSLPISKSGSSSNSNRAPSVDSVFVGAQQQLAEPTCCYQHDRSNLPSRATFFWLNPLLLAGYWTPLEHRHLGPLPDEHKAAVLGRRIRRLLLPDKTPGSCQSGTNSLWRCYWSFSWPAILLGGLLKFFGDLVGYVAPLGIQVVVAYLNASSTSAPAVNSSSTAEDVTGQLDYPPSWYDLVSNGYVMAGIVFLSCFLQGVLSQSSSHVLCVEGIRLKTALQSFTYDKSLRLSSLTGGSSTESSSGREAANKKEDQQQGQPDDYALLDAGTFSQLLTEDCGNVMVLLSLGHYLWAIPLKLVVLLYLLHRQLRAGSVVAAIICLLVMVPAQFLLGSKISGTNKLAMKEADRRLAKILEWLSNMKLFRLYAWEYSGMSRIQSVRRRELSHLWSYSLQWAWATFLTQASTVLLTLLSFVLYPLFSADESPPPAQALSGLALINQFTVPLTIIPVIVPDLIAAWNSTIRLEEFFQRPEVENKQGRTAAAGPKVTELSPQQGETEGMAGRQIVGALDSHSLHQLRLLDKIAEDSGEELSGTENSTTEEPHLVRPGESLVKIHQATFSWLPSCEDAESSTFRLTGLDLEVRRGRLTVVVGPVGSGKSSLLMALLGELQLRSGSVTWSGPSGSHQQLGYVAQKPWLMAATLRDNILFGSTLNAKRYRKVLDACALATDLESWELRDSTPIGSKGQNVSGGQKARIALARAIYSSAPTVLLDDPFAALDRPVAQHVFRRAVQRLLLRHGRTVVMATHQMDLAQSADHLIVMEAGRIIVQGTPDQVATAWPDLTAPQPHLAEEDVEALPMSGTSRAKDRWNMLRLVTKTGNVFIKSGGRKEEEGVGVIQHHPLKEDIDEDAEQQQVTQQRWKRRSSRLNALSIHMSHDLPLLTDEMMLEDEAALTDRFLLLDRDRIYPAGSRPVSATSGSFRMHPLNGPMPEALPSVRTQPRSISFSVRAGATAMDSTSSGGGQHTSAIALFLMRRRQRRRSSSNSRDSLTVPRDRLLSLQQVSLHPLPGETPVSSFPGDSEDNGGEVQLRKSSTGSTGSFHRNRFVQRLLSTVSGFSDDVANGTATGDECWDAAVDTTDPERGLLVDPAATEEERQYGRVPRRLYWLYIRSCGLWLALTYFLGSLAWQAARIATDYWLVVRQIEANNQQTFQWDGSFVDLNQSLVLMSTDSSHERISGFNYLDIYCLLSVVSVVAALLSNILGQAAGHKGRTRLHDDLLTSLSRCRTRLFDVEPTGRLLNRFNSDMSMIDKKLATTFQRLVQFVLMCLSAIAVNAFISWWSLAVAMVVVGVFYFLQRFFRTSARELQRLESLAKGPVVSHLTETLSGLATLRAFGQQHRFLVTMHEHVDGHTASTLVLNSANRWLGTALDSLGAAAVLAAMLLALVVHQRYPGFITAGQVGLAVNYTLMTPIYLQWVVRFWSELEMYFNAVERVLHYSHLRPESASAPTESTAAVTTAKTRDSWPMKGDLEISHLTVTYDASLSPVIRDLSLSVGHGQKVGIFGRTGSGKSTMVNAIFRLADTTAGSIKLDGVDISALDPHHLRSRLAAVPQDTLIIAGTLRDNLDPEHQFSDDQLYSVLEKVHLKEAVKSSGGLDSDNCNLSVGQQQMLSLARAALRPSPFLILDEPSSALDSEAEHTLHHCLDHLFGERTIILISHRVSSLQRCDLICLMEDGRLVLQGPPDQVLSQFAIDE